MIYILSIRLIVQSSRRFDTSIPVIRKATDAFNVNHVEMLGYEADDLIASYAKAAINEKMKVTIVSSDKDLMQLVKEDVLCLIQ